MPLRAEWLRPYGEWTAGMLMQVDDSTLLAFGAWADRIGDGTIWYTEVNRRNKKKGGKHGCSD